VSSKIAGAFPYRNDLYIPYAFNGVSKTCRWICLNPYYRNEGENNNINKAIEYLDKARSLLV
jgi:hypothetical protein